MKGILSKLTLEDEFLFNGTIEELNEKIRFDRNQKFVTEWTSHNSFKVFSKLSGGTWTWKNGGLLSWEDGISGIATLSELNNGKTKVNLKTKVRPELYLFMILTLLVLTFGMFINTDFPKQLFWILPFGTIWFWIIFRFQEKRLFEKVRKYLTKDGILKFN